MFRRAGLAALVALLAAGCADRAGPVSTKGRAVAIAKRQLGTMAFEGRRLEVERREGLWIVRLDPDPTDKSKVFASVEIDAATGQVTGGEDDIYEVGLKKP